MPEHRATPPPEPGAATTFHVRRAMEGDSGSLSWIVERLSPLLLSHATYRMGPILQRRCDPQDLVNDAWLAVLPQLSQLRARGDRYTPVLLRYLSQTVLFRIQKLARQHYREQAASPGVALETHASERAVDPAAQVSGVVTRAIRRELVDAVREKLDELEESDREVVLLCGVEQLSMKVAAMRLGASRDAVAKRYQRALAKLRARLPGSVFDEL